MKTRFIILFTFLNSLFYHSQLSQLDINFDNYISETNNDLKNYFTYRANNYKLFKDGSNYVVQTPVNDVFPDTFLTLCPKYHGVDNETMKISIDFKTKFHTGTGKGHAAGIYIFKDGQQGRIFGSYITNKTLYIGGLENSNDITDFQLGTSDGYIDNTWYRLSLEISKIGINKYRLKTDIYSLGESGTLAPKKIIGRTNEGNNYNFNPNNNVIINLTSTTNGYGKYLDNFSIYGNRSNLSNCSNLNTSDVKRKNIFIAPNPAKDIIHVSTEKTLKSVDIYDSLGKLIKTDFKNNIDISQFSKGNYILKIKTDQGETTEKLIKE
ncbi:T9SS type A sorting domain-containing protein [Epilithonimonas zeae]|uniref:T9SS type A sorting domain-containing protein n=1 Tax=Epilithonimonas zeae TaxID=1416779 RepID=UPI00200E2FED|nr:T9SS type A sorting domain-containing protein [Epilithonimonas zeae]UQB70059.1 T9SS type A sorting domain-containing protein [Epilithonimonas zeae]